MKNRECVSCIKRKTPYCPTSIECMATDDMPYYQNRMMLLKENQELRKLKTYFIDDTGEKLEYTLDDYMTILDINIQQNKQICELKKQLETINEQANYLRKSVERKEETIIDLQNERVPYTNEYVAKLEKKKE